MGRFLKGAGAGGGNKVWGGACRTPHQIRCLGDVHGLGGGHSGIRVGDRNICGWGIDKESKGEGRQRQEEDKRGKGAMALGGGMDEGARVVPS